MIREKIYNIYKNKYGDNLVGVFPCGIRRKKYDFIVVYIPASKLVTLSIKHYKGIRAIEAPYNLLPTLWKTQDISFLEILFSPYGKINKRYKKSWDKILKRREKIVRLDIENFITVNIKIALANDDMYYAFYTFLLLKKYLEPENFHNFKEILYPSKEELEKEYDFFNNYKTKLEYLLKNKDFFIGALKNYSQIKILSKEEFKQIQNIIIDELVKKG